MTFNQMKPALLITPIALMLALSACKRQGEEASLGDSAEPQATETSTASQAPVELSDEQLQKTLPPPEITPVTVKVTLSPKASAELQRTKEAVLVDVVYGGDPTQKASSQANDLGLIELGRVKKELPGAAEITLTEDVIDKNRLKLTVGQPQIMINVLSAKKTSSNNILSCAFYWETLKVAGQAPVVIPCKLLSEESAAQ